MQGSSLNYKSQKMKKRFKILVLSTLFLCLGCPDKDEIIDSEVTVFNNSDEDIVVKLELNEINDTLVADIDFPLGSHNISERIIMPNDRLAELGGFIHFFELNPTKEVKIFIFSKQTILEVPWEQIAEQNLVLARFDLTLQDLEDMNWLVEYP